MLHVRFLAVLLLLPLLIQAQDSLTYQAYIQTVLAEHPLAKQAGIQSEKAEAQYRIAKGMLDPVLSSDWREKNFDGKQYYRQYGARVTVPTPLGIGVTAGYENTSGYYLNPENRTGDYGLWHLGIELNVLQGLLINERRVALQQAKVYEKMTEVEQQRILNDLLFSASMSYIQWQKYFFSNKALEQNLELSKTYFTNTRTAFLGGEKTAQDTLEAFLRYQDLRLQLQNNTMALNKSKMYVESFLWKDGQPAKLKDEATAPENYSNQFFPTFDTPDATSLDKHPVLRATALKINSKEIEQKLKREKLKPKLKLKYNPLLGMTTNAPPVFSTNDFKWGFQFSMPLLLRSERGALQKNKLKVVELKLKLDNKRNELDVKMRNAWQQRELYAQQMILIERNVQGYAQLLEGEREKFRMGESSVFVVNKRQEKYTATQLKMISTKIKQQGKTLEYLYYSNQLIP